MNILQNIVNLAQSTYRSGLRLTREYGLITDNNDLTRLSSEASAISGVAGLRKHACEKLVVNDAVNAGKLFFQGGEEDAKLNYILSDPFNINNTVRTDCASPVLGKNKFLRTMAAHTLSVEPALREGYRINIADTSLQQPLALNEELYQRAIALRRQKPYDHALGLFNFLIENVAYGQSKRRTGYSNSIETWLNRQGVCGEMSFLYVAMARAGGLRSQYIEVLADNNGRKMNHGCASVELERTYYVDIAGKAFDAKYIHIRALSDSQLQEYFKGWRKTA